MKYVASEALGMNANQWRSGLYVTHNQGDSFFYVVTVSLSRRAKAVDAKLPPARGKVRRCHLMGRLITHHSIIAGQYENQVLTGDKKGRREKRCSGCYGKTFDWDSHLPQRLNRLRKNSDFALDLKGCGFQPHRKSCGMKGGFSREGNLSARQEFRRNL
jgi:hypothetical protein